MDFVELVLSLIPIVQFVKRPNQQFVNLVIMDIYIKIIFAKVNKKFPTKSINLNNYFIACPQG